jgi:hypothetical protein
MRASHAVGLRRVSVRDCLWNRRSRDWGILCFRTQRQGPLDRISKAKRRSLAGILFVWLPQSTLIYMLETFNLATVSILYIFQIINHFKHSGCYIYHLLSWPFHSSGDLWSTSHSGSPHSNPD